MKRFPRALLLILIFFACNPIIKKSNEKTVETLDQLIEKENFFKLKATYEANVDKLSETHALFYKAKIDNVFNQAQESNRAIQELLANHSEALNDTMLSKLYSTKLLNHINLYEYSEASKASQQILTNYNSLFDSLELENLQNEIKIWRGLKDVAKQEIFKTKDVLIPLEKDKVGLFNIDVNFGDSTKSLIFDTGANFSIIVRSLAAQLNLEIIDADFYVTAATGTQVNSDIAIASQIDIAGITLKNVFFLVVDDKALSFPQIDYYISGGIGFPVIEALEEIRVQNDNKVFVPKSPVDYGLNNLALNGLMPIIAVEFNNDTLGFNFDTGATSTSLYPRFYTEFHQEVKNELVRDTFSVGSGGGIKEFEGYTLATLNLKVADSEAELERVDLYSEQKGDEESNFYGNFGQDYISKFNEMIISFKYASVMFQ